MDIKQFVGTEEEVSSMQVEKLLGWGSDDFPVELEFSKGTIIGYAISSSHWIAENLSHLPLLQEQWDGMDYSSPSEGGYNNRIDSFMEQFGYCLPTNFDRTEDTATTSDFNRVFYWSVYIPIANTMEDWIYDDEAIVVIQDGSGHTPGKPTFFVAKERDIGYSFPIHWVGEAFVQNKESFSEIGNDYDAWETFEEAGFSGELFYIRLEKFMEKYDLVYEAWEPETGTLLLKQEQGSKTMEVFCSLPYCGV